MPLFPGYSVLGLKRHDVCTLFSNVSEKEIPILIYVQTGKANVAKCEQLMNISEGYVSIHYTILATFL